MKCLTSIKVVPVGSVRDLPTRPRCVNKEDVARYWFECIEKQSWFEPEKECAVVIALNTRNGIIAHALVSIGTLNSTLLHPREVFRPAIVLAAAAIVLVHNHPSGDSTPSSDDITISRQLHQAGELLKIELVDHVIIGSAVAVSSLRVMGLLP